MRVHFVFLALGLLHVALAISLGYHNSYVPRAGHQRALTDLFGGLDGGQEGPTQDAESAVQVSANTRLAGETSKMESDPFGLFPPFMTTSSGSAESPRSKDTASTTKAPSGSATSTSAPLTPTPTASTPTSTPSPGLVVESAPSSSASAPPGGSSVSTGTPWKIVGVAVIAFSVVAAILLASVFFDYWWGFVRDALGRRRAGGGVEELVPDWEKASWEVRFGDDRHRYPSFTAPPRPRSGVEGAELEGGLARNRSARSGPSRPASYAGRQAASPGLGLGEPTGQLLRSPRSAQSNPFERGESAETDVYGGIAE
ncbi:hypothetical protein B0H21DRAFT_822199 [Amylocystis lapponica]|nr:hypothetical protein B0H21DRAFT_822199 [Amylocystis lapponica]